MIGRDLDFDQRRFMCTNRRAMTREEAKATLGSYSKKHAKMLEVYQCEFCNLWHLRAVMPDA